MFFRVYYEDTDAGGVMYHGGYLRFAERARTEWLRGLGIEQSRLREEHGVLFAVRRLEVDYLSPARLDDLLEVTAETVKVGAATLDMEQSIRHEGKMLAGIAVRIAAVNLEGRAARMPEWLRNKLLNGRG